MCLFGFFLMVRKSNLVAASTYAFDNKKQLTRSDVTVGKNLILVNIKWSKTNQNKDREHIVPLLEIPNSCLCPVTAYKAMVSVIPGEPSDALFRMKHGNQWLPASYNQFQNKLKWVVARLGFDSRGYSTHSLRRGGATYASAAGVPREYVKLVGDWKSDAVDTYIKVPLASRVESAKVVRSAVLSESS